MAYAYIALIVLAIIGIVGAMCFLTGRAMGYARGALDCGQRYAEGYSKGMQTGIEELRDYLTRKDEIAKTELLTAIKAENRDGVIIPAELLLAYGVDNVQKLPKSVRQEYHIQQNDHTSVDDLIAAERGEDDNG